MPAFPRDELDAMVQRWLEANRVAQESRDWRPLADFYTDDATYGWNVGPRDEFMAVGRDEIRDFALGTEMEGLAGWTYPYQRVLVDDRAGEVVGFWRQVSDVAGLDGRPKEVAGIGGSWFGYAGDRRWAWQRDFFDLGNVTALFVEMMTAGALSEGMRRRIDAAAGPQPGHYRQGEAPAPLWPL